MSVACSLVPTLRALSRVLALRALSFRGRRDYYSTLATMAAPVAAPIAVHADPTADPRKLVILDANEPLVLATAFLPWAPIPAAGGRPARVSLTNREAIVAFIRRCDLSRTLADSTYFGTISMLQFALVRAAWSRILTE